MTSHYPEAILVDLDNTLHDYRRAAATARKTLADAIAQRYGVPTELVRVRYERLIADQDLKVFATGRDMRVWRIGALVGPWSETRPADVADFVEILDEALLSAVRPFDGAIDAFHQIRDKIPVLIVTEGYADIQIPTLRRLGLGLGDHELLITKSHGVRKVDGGAYALALQWLGREAANVLMIGDNWDWDVMASAAVGMRQIWIGSSAEPNAAPDGYLGRIARFADAPKLIERHWKENTGARP